MSKTISKMTHDKTDMVDMTAVITSCKGSKAFMATIAAWLSMWLRKGHPSC